MSEERYIPSEESLKFISFIQAGALEEDPSPRAHYEIADTLFSSDKDDWYAVIECLRGMGKSTLFEYVCIYVAALGYWPGFGKVGFIIFLGASMEGNVDQFFKNIAYKIENSEFYNGLIQVNRCVADEIELESKTAIKLYIQGKGMNVNWRGVRSASGERPAVLLADDVLGNDVMKSMAVRETVETNWYNSALPALNPKRHKIFYIGTPLVEGDLLDKIKKSKSFKHLHIPLCTAWPVEKDEYESVWPERFTYEYTRRMYEMMDNAGKSRSFYTEYMLQLTDLSSLLVEEEDINWFDPTIMMKGKANYNYYIVTDFATSTKKKADFSTLGVFAVSSKKDWFLVDGYCKRQEMQENLEDLFTYSQKWNPLSVGVETSGQQGGFLSILREMMMTRNVWFTLGRKRGSKEVGIRPAKDKLERFITGVLPKFKQNKIWLPKPEICKVYNPRLYQLLEELTGELSKLTMSGGVQALAHDDAIDLLNQLSEMEVYAPTGGEVDLDEKIVEVSGKYWGNLEIDEDENYGGSTIF